MNSRSAQWLSIKSNFITTLVEQPNDVDLRVKTPSATIGSSGNRSDRGPKNRSKAPPKDKSQDTGASSSGLTPAERARSLLLPTTQYTAPEALREPESDSERENDGSRQTKTLP